VHQDIKDRNILIKGENALIGDFGLRGVTPLYCAPETMANNNCSATDIHGLGVTTMLCFYEKRDAICILRCPAKNANVTYDSISNRLLKLVKTMVSVNPSNRPKLGSIRKSLGELTLKDGFYITPIVSRNFLVYK